MELRHTHFCSRDSLDIGREAAEFAVFRFSITFAPYKWKRYGDLRPHVVVADSSRDSNRDVRIVFVSDHDFLLGRVMQQTVPQPLIIVKERVWFQRPVTARGAAAR